MAEPTVGATAQAGAQETTVEKARARVFRLLAWAGWRGMSVTEIGDRLPGRQRRGLSELLGAAEAEGTLTSAPFMTHYGRRGTRYWLVLPPEDMEIHTCPVCCPRWAETTPL